MQAEAASLSLCVYQSCHTHKTPFRSGPPQPLAHSFLLALSSIKIPEPGVYTIDVQFMAEHSTDTCSLFLDQL